MPFFFSFLRVTFCTEKVKYEKIGLHFNEIKTELLVFNNIEIDLGPDIKLGDKIVKPSSSIVCIFV